MKLFCLHHAGGNGYAYYQWKKYLKNYEIIPLDLPGHGIRIQENLLYDLGAAVDELFTQITSRIDNGESYVLFGHSMGGILILYILDKLKNSKYKLPCFVILSGASNLGEISDRKNTMNMSEKELIDMIFSQGGTDMSLLESQEFKECFLPIIRADYIILDKQKEYSICNKKFNVKAAIFNGTSDLGALNCEIKLMEYFAENVTVVHFDGDHFYFDSQIEYVCKKVDEVIRKSIEGKISNAINY